MDSRNLNSQSGSIFVELIVPFPLLLLFLVALVDFGLYLNSYLLLTRAVHEGVMTGIRLPAIQDGIFSEQGVPGEPHAEIYQRVRTTLNSYTGTGKLHGINLSSLLLSSQTFPLSSEIERAVLVRIQTDYESLLGLQISYNLSFTGPYVLSS